MIIIDEDKMREEVEGFIEAELYNSTFSDSVIELVWEIHFKEAGMVTDEDDAIATKAFDKIFRECIDKMLKALKH